MSKVKDIEENIYKKDNMIRRALISVSDKSGIADAKRLSDMGVK